MVTRACQSRQSGDQFICGPCGLSWDTNDTEPPKCQHRSVGAIVRKIERHYPEPVFNAEVLVHQVANRTLTKAEFMLCRAIADEAYTLGRKSNQGQ